MTRLADEYTKSLQKINPHTGEYVARLKVRREGGKEGGMLVAVLVGILLTHQSEDFLVFVPPCVSLVW